MKPYFSKDSAVCLISILGFMSYETAAYGDASLIIQPQLANNDLKLIDVIFKSNYSVNIENRYGIQYYILTETYPEIKISAKFGNDGPVEIFPCSPANVTVNENDYLFLTVTSYKNKPDKPTCTLRIERRLTPIIKSK